MSSSARAGALATLDTLLAVPEHRRFHEVIAGELTKKAAATGEHGATQAALAGTLFGPFSRKPAGEHRAAGGSKPKSKSNSGRVTFTALMSSGGVARWGDATIPKISRCAAHSTMRSRPSKTSGAHS
jgi:hypothetical protein